MHTPLEPYRITDEIFRYIHDNPSCQVTDIEYYIRQTYPSERGLNIRPALVTLRDAGLIHIEAAFTYVSMMPFGKEIIIKDGLYSLYLQRLKDEKNNNLEHQINELTLEKLQYERTIRDLEKALMEAQKGDIPKNAEDRKTNVIWTVGLGVVAAVELVLLLLGVSFKP